MDTAQERVVVIGAGVAGAAAALSLARAGASVTVLERDDFIGGHAAKLTCKAVDSCQECGGCVAEPLLAELGGSRQVKLLRRAKVTAAERGDGGISLTVEQGPALIDPNRCTVCGLCLEACPQPGTIRKAPLDSDPLRLAIDPQACLHLQGRPQAPCQDTCPEGAIDLAAQAESGEIEADAVVVATGFKPYPAELKRRWGYGRVPNVVTALELESMLRGGNPPARPSDGAAPQRVGFIQCVGSRERAGNNYCSRVCCGYALRMGRMMHQRYGTDVTVFYMDVQSFGHDFDRFWDQAGRELNLVRCLPADVWPAEGDTVLVEHQAEPGAKPVMAELDMLALSVAMTPDPDTQALLGLLGGGDGPHGFGADGDGVFVAGTAGGPMSLAESAASGEAAAWRALRHLRGEDAWLRETA